jgi:preprotein translocase subunit SecG
MDLLLVLVVVALIVVLVGAPLRRRGADDADEQAERAELEAARDAKYREIRDADLDHRTGKLSDADWRAQDRSLRAEAVDILRRLDELGPSETGRFMVTTVLSVLQVFIAVILVLLILLHSGKDAGMSGAFGVGTAGGSSGGSLMERNLDRWTILFAVLFAVNTLVLLKI